MQLLLGEGEFATRLPFWIYWLGVFWTLCRMRQRVGPLTWGSLVAFGLGILLIAQWYTFYVGYDPYMSDLANPGVPDALFTLLLTLSFDALLEEDLAGWGIAILLGSLVLYAGPVMLGLTTLSALVFRPVERSRMLLRRGGGFGVGLGHCRVVSAVGLVDRDARRLDADVSKRVLDELCRSNSPRPADSALCGILPVGCRRRGRAGSDRCSKAHRVGADCGDGFGGLSPHRAWLRGQELALSGSVVPWRLGVVGDSVGKPPERLAGRVGGGWPVSEPHRLLAQRRPIFTLTRDLGVHTTYQTDSYQEACRWADLAVLYDLGITSWDVPPHTWVRYSNLEAQPKQRRAILLTTADFPPPGYVVRAHESQSGLKICLDLHSPEVFEWAANQYPLIGPDRFPAVLSEIAPVPRPRLPRGPESEGRHSEVKGR